MPSWGFFFLISYEMEEEGGNKIEGSPSTYFQEEGILLTVEPSLSFPPPFPIGNGITTVDISSFSFFFLLKRKRKEKEGPQLVI